MATFDELLSEAEAHPTGGWDFSWLEGRMQTSALPWDFDAIVAEHAHNSRDLLDLGTGGGEWLASLPHRPPRTVATEAWPPNVPVATRRLAPLGIEVVQVEPARDNVVQTLEESDPRLPFADASFQLAVDRHESFVAREVARVLEPGGHFVSQQLGDGLYGDFRTALGAEQPAGPPLTLRVATAQLEAAGLSIVRAAEAEQVVTFAAVGALAWYLRMIPWTVPGFSIATHRDRLRELHARMPLGFRLPAFFLAATKPA